MAQTIKHVTKRNGVFQYQRRVPQEVKDRPAQFDAVFGGKDLFRRSLRTKDQMIALLEAAKVEDEFERLVRTALALTPKPHIPLRPVSGELLKKLAEQERTTFVRPYIAAVIYQESEEGMKEEKERLLTQLEFDAPHLSKVLGEGIDTEDPRFEIDSAVDLIIAENGLDAPLGSPSRGLIKRAVRDGRFAGASDAHDYLTGKKSVLTEIGAYGAARSVVKLSDVVNAYSKTLTAKRTRIELESALRSFVDAIGDLPLDEIKKSDVVAFCKAEGTRLIGGRTRNSVVRPVSSQTLRKKLGLLRSSVNRAIKRLEFDGANPFAAIDATMFTQKTPAATMPPKRPFRVDELNQIFAYPWFSGCASPANTHAPGTHRLTGMHYWVPIMAALTGCRAGELGGLMLVD